MVPDECTCPHFDKPAGGDEPPGTVRHEAGECSRSPISGGDPQPRLSEDHGHRRKGLQILLVREAQRRFGARIRSTRAQGERVQDGVPAAVVLLGPLHRHVEQFRVLQHHHLKPRLRGQDVFI
jgi:hypothetical protein